MNKNCFYSSSMNDDEFLKYYFYIYLVFNFRLIEIGKMLMKQLLLELIVRILEDSECKWVIKVF